MSCILKYIRCHFFSSYLRCGAVINSGTGPSLYSFLVCTMSHSMMESSTPGPRASLQITTRTWLDSPGLDRSESNQVRSTLSSFRYGQIGRYSISITCSKVYNQHHRYQVMISILKVNIQCNTNAAVLSFQQSVPFQRTRYLTYATKIITCLDRTRANMVTAGLMLMLQVHITITIFNYHTFCFMKTLENIFSFVHMTIVVW